MLGHERHLASPLLLEWLVCSLVTKENDRFGKVNRGFTISIHTYFQEMCLSRVSVGCQAVHTDYMQPFSSLVWIFRIAEQDRGTSSVARALLLIIEISCARCKNTIAQRKTGIWLAWEGLSEQLFESLWLYINACDRDRIHAPFTLQWYIIVYSVRILETMIRVNRFKYRVYHNA